MTHVYYNLGLFQQTESINVYTFEKTSTLQHSATLCNTLQHSATLCNTLQHSATLCNTLQLITHKQDIFAIPTKPQHTATHRTALQHTTIHCNKLQLINHKQDNFAIPLQLPTSVAHCNSPLTEKINLKIFGSPGKKIGSSSGVISTGTNNSEVNCTWDLWKFLRFEISFVFPASINSPATGVTYKQGIVAIPLKLQHTATRTITLQHTATHCNTLQHTATHCNTLQHTATHYPNALLISKASSQSHCSCNTLQHVVFPCNTLQHAATHYP